MNVYEIGSLAEKLANNAYPGRGIAVFLPGESQGQGSLVSYHLWGHTESDTTEAT